MFHIIYEGRIDGEFEGFDDEVIFKMTNDTYWIQDQYKYWYHYAYNPQAKITEDNGRFILSVADNSIPVRRADNIIESCIDGEFNGWMGESVYKLVNGQKWQQSSYKYQYKYSYMPQVIIYQTRSGYKMLVAGTTAYVRKLG
ncbi:MAG: hypothetical protein HZA77_13145 [Candidatus Schekmanbacteria bacterium]|nr:hypothetical protein [Candidatus Schekmanbacteria bacterium]